MTKMLVASRRRCALCYGLDGDTTEKAGQIAHVDRDAENTAEENAAWLCSANSGNASTNHNHIYDRAEIGSSVSIQTGVGAAVRTLEWSDTRSNGQSATHRHAVSGTTGNGGGNETVRISGTTGGGGGSETVNISGTTGSGGGSETVTISGTTGSGGGSDTVSISGTTAASGGDATVNISGTTGSGGSSTTPAPYVQLLACRRVL